jgi:hypothetical protein
MRLPADPAEDYWEDAQLLDEKKCIKHRFHFGPRTWCRSDRNSAARPFHSFFNRCQPETRRRADPFQIEADA